MQDVQTQTDEIVGGSKRLFDKAVESEEKSIVLSEEKSIEQCESLIEQSESISADDDKDEISNYESEIVESILIDTQSGQSGESLRLSTDKNFKSNHTNDDDDGI